MSSPGVSAPRKARQDRPLAEQHEECLRACAVTPVAAGQRTAMVLRFINEQGRELNRVVFSRIAGG